MVSGPEPAGNEAKLWIPYGLSSLFSRFLLGSIIASGKLVSEAQLSPIIASLLEGSEATCFIFLLAELRLILNFYRGYEMALLLCFDD